MWVTREVISFLSGKETTVFRFCPPVLASADHTLDMVEINKERIEELARQKLEGKSYSEIRAELLKSGMPDGEVSHLIRQVDEKVLEAAAGEGRVDRVRQWNRTGLFLAVTGLIISIAYNAGMILENLPALAVYSPFFAGILVMFYARMVQRKPPGKQDHGPGPIRKRRPFK
jgi:hypothetical protein